MAAGCVFSRPHTDNFFFVPPGGFGLGGGGVWFTKRNVVDSGARDTNVTSNSTSEQCGKSPGSADRQVSWVKTGTARPDRRPPSLGLDVFSVFQLFSYGIEFRTIWVR